MRETSSLPSRGGPGALLARQIEGTRAVFRNHLAIVYSLSFVAIAIVSATVLSVAFSAGPGLMQVAAPVIFVASVPFGLVAFRLAEPRVLRSMLRHALELPGASGGVMLATSLARASALVDAYSPVVGGFRNVSPVRIPASLGQADLLR